MTGCALLAVVWALFGPPAEVSTLALLAFGAVALTQLALLFSPPVMAWAVEKPLHDE